ncbi:inositol monophosphatase [candidate division KSB1 bacterium]|nr:inositol monophosphatase [candidate division KSB1 bacterium]
MNEHVIAHAKSLAPELHLAARAAEIGGRILLQYWQQLSESQIHEKAKGDLVTAADLAVERAVTEFLHRETPEIAIVAEEGTEVGGSGAVWYVDPLDGTTNFVQRFPVFAVSIGLAASGDQSHADLLCGIVFNPVSSDCFYAAKGRGSYRNGKRLRATAKRRLSDGMIATGFPRRYHDELPVYLREFAALFPHCRAIRRAGSAALDLCWTAQALFDGFWEHHLAPWDIAAGAMIVEEAGGICSDFDGGRAFLHSGDIIGAGPDIHPEFLRRIQAARKSP